MGIYNLSSSGRMMSNLRWVKDLRSEYGSSPFYYEIELSAYETMMNDCVELVERPSKEGLENQMLV